MSGHSILCSSWVSVFGVMGSFLIWICMWFLAFDYWHLYHILLFFVLLKYDSFVKFKEYDSFVKFHCLFLKSWYWIQLKDLRVQRKWKKFFRDCCVANFGWENMSWCRRKRIFSFIFNLSQATWVLDFFFFRIFYLQLENNF